MGFDFSLYIHYPFCLSKCPYCDFNSHINQNIEIDNWADAYYEALKYHKNKFPLGKIKTIFFGGGTPSLMPIKLVDDILNKAQALFGFCEDIEITLEANPTSSEAQKFEDFSKAGINRLSMGIQSLNDHDLRKLGRTHSATEAMQAFEMAREIFSRTSFDLIYARENQTLELWEQELRQAADLCVGHISLYQLTIEPETRFADWYKRGKISLPTDALSEEMYFLTDEILSEYHYKNYEISNYATANNECRHNMMYWQYQPYIGIGAGAHGRVPLDDVSYLATQTHKMPNDWLKEPTIFTNTEIITKEDYDLEYLLMSLRTLQGCDLARLQTNLIIPEKMQDLLDDGLLVLNKQQLIATKKGRPILNALIRALI